MDVDAETGSITALPRRNGNFVLFLVAEDDAGMISAANQGLPAQLNQVILKRWSFTVVGKPDFAVIRYSRVDAETLPAVAAGDEPYRTDRKIGAIRCTVGSIYRIAPIDIATLVSAHASGGASAKIRFTIRKPVLQPAPHSIAHGAVPRFECS